MYKVTFSCVLLITLISLIAFSSAITDLECQKEFAKCQKAQPKAEADVTFEKDPRKFCCGMVAIFECLPKNCNLTGQLYKTIRDEMCKGYKSNSYACGFSNHPAIAWSVATIAVLFVVGMIGAAFTCRYRKNRNSSA